MTELLFIRWADDRISLFDPRAWQEWLTGGTKTPVFTGKKKVELIMRILEKYGVLTKTEKQVFPHLRVLAKVQHWEVDETTKEILKKISKIKFKAHYYKRFLEKIDRPAELLRLVDPIYFAQAFKAPPFGGGL